MDCVRTAVRQGAASVKCLYRRAQGEHAWLGARGEDTPRRRGSSSSGSPPPKASTATTACARCGCRGCALGLPDATGRQAVEPVPGSDFTIEADLVIKALGFDPEPLPALWDADGLEVSRWGTLKVDHRTLMTSIPGVFAAGDIVRGASLVVWAIRDGRDVAGRDRQIPREPNRLGGGVRGETGMSDSEEGPENRTESGPEFVANWNANARRASPTPIARATSMPPAASASSHRSTARPGATWSKGRHRGAGRRSGIAARGRRRRQDRRRRRHPCRDPARFLRRRDRAFRRHTGSRPPSPSARCSCPRPTTPRRSAAGRSSRPRSSASATRSTAGVRCRSTRR